MTKKQFVQWNFEITGLIPSQVRIKRKVWLKKDELFVKEKDGKLYAYLLGDEGFSFKDEDVVAPYMRVASLITSNTPEVESRGAVGLASKEEFGTKPVYHTSVKSVMPAEAVAEIEKNAHKFLNFIGRLHDKYIDIIKENDFLEIALDYFYDSEKKFSYSNEGLISAIISMEALLNEGPSDIKYKLSHRAAFLLGFCDVDAGKAFEELKDYYNKRSQLVHGVGSLKDRFNGYSVTKYTRTLISIFMILLKSSERRAVKKNIRKIEILKEIDHAMFSETRRKKLQKEIRTGLQDFKLPVPRTFEGSGAGGNYYVTAW